MTIYWAMYASQLQNSVVDPTAQVIGRGKRIKGVSIDVAETGNVLDANGRKVVVLCCTNKGMVSELMKFRKVTGGRFPRWCYSKEEQALPDATTSAKLKILRIN